MKSVEHNTTLLVHHIVANPHSETLTEWTILYHLEQYYRGNDNHIIDSTSQIYHLYSTVYPSWHICAYSFSLNLDIVPKCPKNISARQTHITTRPYVSVNELAPCLLVKTINSKINTNSQVESAVAVFTHRNTGLS